MTTRNNTLVLARSEKGVIGYNGHIPWYVPTDLLRFRHVTMAHDFMVMGMRTFMSLPRMLDGRRHVVVTKDPKKAFDNYVPFANKEKLKGKHEISFVDWAAAEDLLRSSHSCAVIGGAEVANLALPLIGNIYLTTVKNVEIIPNDGDEVTVFDYNPYHDFELMEYLDDGDAIYERFRRRHVKR